jgi:homoserine kinase
MKVRVQVPATSANLGPGFDVAGLALTLYNTFVFELQEEVQISGCPEQFCNEDNLTYQAFKQAAEACGLQYNGVYIDCAGEVPYTRGLGSSSTCIVAGIVGAFAFMNKAEERQQILELATKIEGHPDNVAPAIFGGLTVSVVGENKVVTLNIPIQNKYRFVALIPPFTLSTEQSRSVLPEVLSRQDAIKNVSHLALLVASLINGHDDGLKVGFDDFLHQPYRGKLIEGFNEIVTTLKADNIVLGCYLSGAGPTIMALIHEDDIMGVVRIKEELGDLINGWQVQKLELDNRGYTVDYE